MPGCSGTASIEHLSYANAQFATEVPTGQLKDLRSGLDSYRKDHERLVQFVKTTDVDLRSYIVARQGCDAYQWALLISTHEQRHVLQIREIKADRRFPK